MIRNIGITGTTFSGQQKKVYFDRMPGAKEDQIRIRTADYSIYLSESDFVAMIRELFASDAAYQPKHGEGGNK